MPSRQPRRLLALSAATALAAGAVVSIATRAEAATATFTQSGAITVTHGDGDHVSGTNSTNVAIPDVGSASSSVTLGDVPANASARWVEAAVHLTHPFMDDVDLVLVSPSGKATTLASDIGGANITDGWVVFNSDQGVFGDDGDCLTGCHGSPTDFDTTPGDLDAHPGVAPADFGALGGSPVSGTWTLHAYDDEAGHVGQINDFELHVFYGLPASPSPSTMQVSGLAQATTDIDLVLNDVSGYIGDTEILLQSPDGRYAHVLSDVANDDELVDVDLTLDDEATARIPRISTPDSGSSYRPHNYNEDGEQSEPVGGVETLQIGGALSAFDGGNPNGTWRLWVFQEACCATVEIGSWSLSVSTLDTPPAAPVVTSPASGTRVRDDAVTLAGTAGDGAVVRVIEGGATRSTVADGGFWSVTVAGLADGAHTFAIIQTDKRGNTSSPASVTVVVDTKAPKARKTTPRHGADGVKVTVSPTVRFSEGMNVTSLTRKVRLVTPSGERVRAKVSWDATKNTVVVDPKRKLARHTTYTLKVTKGARDLAGNRLVKGKRVQFTTD